LADDPDLAAFVREHVRSVWALELLLLLKRDPDRTWAPQALVAELRASPSLVVDNLHRFEASGLALRDEGEGWRYAPASPLLAQLADQLERAYRERPVSVINVIAAPPDPIQGLADAFKFRGDK
jgi:hypothetical protein